MLLLELLFKKDSEREDVVRRKLEGVAGVAPRAGARGTQRIVSSVGAWDGNSGASGCGRSSGSKPSAARSWACMQVAALEAVEKFLRVCKCVHES